MGPLAEEMAAAREQADNRHFTDEVWEFGSTDGEIFAAIAQGTSADMESYGERITATKSGAW